MEKEKLYVMGYYSTTGNFVVKIGTSNDIVRRMKEHNRYYQNTPNEPMAANETIRLYGTIPLSKYNTIRYEDKNREKLIKERYGTYLKNDRFVFEEKPNSITLTIRKNYTIKLEG